MLGDRPPTSSPAPASRAAPAVPAARSGPSSERVSTTPIRRCCLGCEQDLRSPGEASDAGSSSSPPRCPECGREFDPEDPRTWRRGRRGGFERVVGRCGISGAAASAVPVLILWYAQSMPAGGFSAWAVGTLLLIAFMIVWLVKLGVRLGIRLRLGGPGPIAAREWGWLVGPVVIVAGTAIAGTMLPLRVGLAVARGDLERLRADLGSGGVTLPAAAGWCRIEKVSRSWLIVETRTSSDGRRRDTIVNVIREAEMAKNAALRGRVEGAVADPAALLRPGSPPIEGQRILEAIRFEVAGTGFLDSGWWGWIPDGPDDLAGLDQSWRRVSGDWYAMRESW